MKTVIDCSAAFKWVVAEPDTDKAVRLRDDYRNGVLELIAPDLFPTEIANAILVAERGGRIPSGQGAQLLITVLNTFPVLHPALPDLMPRAYAIAAQARQTRMSVYGCLYVALAEREGCDLVTADDRLVRALQPQFPFIVPLSSLP
jgi:predicted nucleic acid-binding protein